MDSPEIIQRLLYLDRIQSFIDKNIIKVLVGHRRTGKSFLMLNIMDLIRKSDPDANIIYLNKEHYEFDHIKDYHGLQHFFDEQYSQNHSNYFFVDEIQEIQQFEKCIRNIYSKKLADVYISGSNADLLSGELASMLSGRYIEIKIHPLTYPEFLSFFKLSDSPASFSRYLKQGGMPGLLQLHHSESTVIEYLNGILSTVLLKDVIARYNIRNVTFLENLLRFLSHNTGSLVSAKNISDFLKSQRIHVSPNLVLDYLTHLCSAYVTNKVLRMEVSGKKIFEINEKYYFEDLGIRNCITGYKPDDIAKLLENVVYNHLVVAGYNVHIGQKGAKEIDFIAERDGETIYVQVCYLLADEKVIEREFGNLLEIQDNYTKYVVSMDDFSAPNTYKGIIHQTVPEFCINLFAKSQA
ncbi:MAG: ATP-binding protein [Lentimicrobium sp.]